MKPSPKQAKEISALCKAYYGARVIMGGGDTPEKIEARKLYGEASAKLAKRIFGLTLTAEEAFRCMKYHQSEWLVTNPGTLAERIAALSEAVKTEKYCIGPEDEEIQLDDYFRRVFFAHDYKEGPRPVGTVECGGMMIEDTPKSLYRILFLAQPKQLDFSDMYKTGGWIDLVSPDYHFVAHVELWKYELAVRFSASREHVTGRMSDIQCGIPGSNNGISGASPLLAAWQECLTLCLNSKWNVYGGNNFTV